MNEINKTKVGVLASGRGSNFRALCERASSDPDYPAEIACLVVNLPDAGALNIAKEFGVEANVINHKKFKNRNEFEKQIVDYLKSKDVEIIVLAGFMRIISETLLDAFPMKILNIHPALLPSFQGLHAQERAFDYGCQITGCTAHIVDKGTDTGPIILQTAVTAHPNDTADTLAARILEQEHKILPEALQILCEGNYNWEGRRFVSANYKAAKAVLKSPVKEES